jgi:hypothetical protein
MSDIEKTFVEKPLVKQFWKRFYIGNLLFYTVGLVVWFADMIIYSRTFSHLIEPGLMLIIALINSTSIIGYAIGKYQYEKGLGSINIKKVAVELGGYAFIGNLPLIMALLWFIPPISSDTLMVLLTGSTIFFILIIGFGWAFALILEARTKEETTMME